MDSVSGTSDTLNMLTLCSQKQKWWEIELQHLLSRQLECTIPPMHLEMIYCSFTLTSSVLRVGELAEGLLASAQ